MAFLKGHKFTKEEIAGAYTVPVSKLTSEDVNRSNAESGDYSWMKDGIFPRLRRIEERFSEKLLRRYDRRLFVAFDNPVPADKAFELEKQDTYVKNGVMSINEVRQEIGLEPVKWGRSPWMPLTVAPVGGSSPVEDEADMEEDEEVRPTEPEEEGTEEEMDEEGKPGQTSVGMKDTEPVQNKQRPEYVRPPRPEYSKMKKVMQKIYREMEQDIKSQLNGMGASPDFDKINFDTNRWERATREQMKKPIQDTLITGGAFGVARLRSERGITDLDFSPWIVKQDLPPGFGFDITNPEVQRWLRSYVAHFSRVTTATTGKKFSAMLARGLAEGDTTRDLRKRVDDFFGGLERYKADQIARSETSRALHQGMEQAWKQSDVVLGKEWLCNPG